MHDTCILSVNERKELTVQIERLTEQISVLMKARQEFDVLVTANNSLVQSKKKIADKLRLDLDYNTDVRMMAEKCLRINLINRAKYHGGQLDGTTVKRLFQKADKIFDDIKNV